MPFFPSGRLGILRSLWIAQIRRKSVQVNYLSVDSKHGTFLLDFLAELDDNTPFHGEIMHETLQYGEI